MINIWKWDRYHLSHYITAGWPLSRPLLGANIKLSQLCNMNNRYSPNTKWCCAAGVYSLKSWQWQRCWGWANVSQMTSSTPTWISFDRVSQSAPSTVYGHNSSGCSQPISWICSHVVCCSVTANKRETRKTRQVTTGICMTYYRNAARIALLSQTTELTFTKSWQRYSSIRSLS